MAKTLQLWEAKETHLIGGQEQVFDFSTAAILQALLPSYDSALGYTVEEIRQRSKLMDRLEEATDSVELTKEMAEMLIKRLENYRVSVPSLNLVKLEEQLKACL
jgi:hypothetical protein